MNSRVRCLRAASRAPARASPISTISPCVHERDALADVAGEAELVGDDDHGHAGRREIAHHGQHLADEFGVERRGRLVEQDQLRPHGERAGDGDALLLAAGELRWIGVALVAEADAVEQRDARVARGLGRGSSQHAHRAFDDVLQRPSGAGTG